MNRPIVYSLSPGTSVTPAIAKSVSGLVNMYRITADDWDSWQDVASHFDISRCLIAICFSWILFFALVCVIITKFTLYNRNDLFFCQRLFCC